MSMPSRHCFFIYCLNKICYLIMFTLHNDITLRWTKVIVGYMFIVYDNVRDSFYLRRIERYEYDIRHLFAFSFHEIKERVFLWERYAVHYKQKMRLFTLLDESTHETHENTCQPLHLELLEKESFIIAIIFIIIHAFTKTFSWDMLFISIFI